MKFLIDFDIAVPPLRNDIEIFTFTGTDGDQQLYLSCPQGYTEALTLPAKLASLLELLNGINSISVITSIMNQTGTLQVQSEGLALFLKDLDELGYLQTPTFYRLKENIQRFQSSGIRPAICAGGAYPQSVRELSEFLDGIMRTSQELTIPARGIIAPHIDLRVGSTAYAPAYNAISKSEADLFIIFATSHYANYDLFIPTTKDFETPLGIVETDRELLSAVRHSFPFKLTSNDIAHKPEHSIELELIFLQHCFARKKFTILPILVTSFHSFIKQGILPNEHPPVKEFAAAVRNVVEQSGRNAVYISSGDLAHIGRKFGDQFDAEPVLPTLQNEDEVLLNSLANCNHSKFFKDIAEVNDKWKICGLSPNYMMLETLQPERGEILYYEQWNEREQKSAVSYASLAFY
ncbi:MAG: AmmeMemoRadiSam system protein B [Ignavibacteriae bacterium]|nr:AmmeMemoRadiSam system protein B [Ignavibacteriota bacterium]